MDGRDRLERQDPPLIAAFAQIDAEMAFVGADVEHRFDLLVQDQVDEGRVVDLLKADPAQPLAHI